MNLRGREVSTRPLGCAASKVAFLPKLRTLTYHPTVPLFFICQTSARPENFLLYNHISSSTRCPRSCLHPKKTRPSNTLLCNLKSSFEDSVCPRNCVNRVSICKA